jgi:hypothetical protein
MKLRNCPSAPEPVRVFSVFSQTKERYVQRHVIPSWNLPQIPILSALNLRQASYVDVINGSLLYTKRLFAPHRADDDTPRGVGEIISETPTSNLQTPSTSTSRTKIEVVEMPQPRRTRLPEHGSPESSRALTEPRKLLKPEILKLCPRFSHVTRTNPKAERAGSDQQNRPSSEHACSAPAASNRCYRWICFDRCSLTLALAF